MNTNNRQFTRLTSLDALLAGLSSAANHGIKVVSGFPFFDIVKVAEDELRIVVALAGYKASDVTVTQEGTTLTVEAAKEEVEPRETYLHKGISQSKFKREFELPTYGNVDTAELKDGLLTIEVKIVIPESQKPRKIDITNVKSEDKATVVKEDEVSAYTTETHTSKSDSKLENELNDILSGQRSDV